MQINRKPVKTAKKGADIGLKISYQPQIEGLVYKVINKNPEAEKPNTELFEKVEEDNSQERGVRFRNIRFPNDILFSLFCNRKINNFYQWLYS